MVSARPDRLACALLCLALLAPARALSWPGESDWEPLLSGGDASDPCGDADGADWWDIVGDADDPAGFVSFDGDNLWFRLRLADAPYSESGGAPHKWRNLSLAVLIESDGDDSRYDYLLYADAKDEAVILSQNTAGGGSFAADEPEVELEVYDAPLAESGSSDAGYAAYQAAGSDVCGGGEDYYVEWYVPWETLAAYSGAADPSELRFALGTGNGSGVLSKDILGCDGGSGCSDLADALADGEGGDPAETDADGDGYAAGDDCDDADAAVNPGAPETCDGADSNCSGDESDAEDAEVFYADEDYDLYGDPNSAIAACERPFRYRRNDLDCDDADASINPSADEYCDLVDNDCDALVDEDDAVDAEVFYADEDYDLYGDPDAPVAACERPFRYRRNDLDCDDADAAVNPGAEESWYDGIDQDCDAASDYDADADTYDSDAHGGDDCDDANPAVYPGAPEILEDGIDNDCGEPGIEPLSRDGERRGLFGLSLAGCSTAGGSPAPGGLLGLGLGLVALLRRRRG